MIKSTKDLDKLCNIYREWGGSGLWQVGVDQKTYDEILDSALEERLGYSSQVLGSDFKYRDAICYGGIKIQTKENIEFENAVQKEVDKRMRESL